MSNKNFFWLIIGLVIGVFATIWWIERRQTALALANHDTRISALEYKNEQRAITDQTPNKMKWYAGMLTLAGAALKLIFTLGHHVKF